MLKLFCFDSAPMKWPLVGGFLCSYSPKYCLILLKFPTEIVYNKLKIVFEKSLKILHFGSNVTHPKVTVLVHFGAQFPTGKPKILLKTKISANTISLVTSNNVSTRNHTEFL